MVRRHIRDLYGTGAGEGWLRRRRIAGKELSASSSKGFCFCREYVVRIHALALQLRARIITWIDPRRQLILSGPLERIVRAHWLK